jgi:membrane protein implicated in regulation of membrane protease activity
MDLAAFYAAHGFWVWTAAGALLLAIEVSMGAGYLLWAAASAVLVGLFVLTGLSPGLAVELGLFAVLTIVTSLLARRFFPPAPEVGPDINDTHHRLIGLRGEAVGAFRAGQGRVFVDGKEWAAEAEGDEALADGERVEVLAVRDGGALMVRRG